jgi:hypothetical protein
MATATRPAPPKVAAPAPKQVANQVQSLNVLKNLVRASISEICFLRNLFPSDMFRPMNFGANTTIRALCPVQVLPSGEKRVLDEAAQHLVQLEEAALDAIEKRYLRSLVLSIHSAGEPSELLESYVCECARVGRVVGRGGHATALAMGGVRAGGRTRR